MLLGKKNKKAFETIARGYLWAAGGFFGAAFLLGAIAAVNFNFFWTNFHHLFFSNNLWILDPSTDVLIQMMPTQLFYDCVIQILIIFVAAVILLAAISGAYLATRSKNRVKKA